MLPEKVKENSQVREKESNTDLTQAQDISDVSLVSRLQVDCPRDRFPSSWS